MQKTYWPDGDRTHDIKMEVWLLSHWTTIASDWESYNFANYFYRVKWAQVCLFCKKIQELLQLYFSLSDSLTN